jgi:hypothetical protein
MEKRYWDPKFHISVIGELMYLANCTRPDIAFAVNLLVRHSAVPAKRYWVGVKNIFRYLQSTKDLGIFFQFQRNLDIDMIGISVLATYLTPIIPDRKPVLCSYMVGQPSYGSLPNRLWWVHPQIILK